MMKRVRRVFGKIEYVRVYEPHPASGALHAHLAVSHLTPYVIPGCYKNLQHGYLPVTTRAPADGSWAIRSWIKKTAQECHIGYQADVRQAESENTVFYITKYLTKISQAINVKGLRHVATSRRIGSPPNEGNDSWAVGDFITTMDIASDETIRDIQTGASISYQQLAYAGAYPAPDEGDLTNGL